MKISTFDRALIQNLLSLGIFGLGTFWANTVSAQPTVEEDINKVKSVVDLTDLGLPNDDSICQLCQTSSGMVNSGVTTGGVASKMAPLVATSPASIATGDTSAGNPQTCPGLAPGVAPVTLVLKATDAGELQLDLSFPVKDDSSGTKHLVSAFDLSNTTGEELKELTGPLRGEVQYQKAVTLTLPTDDDSGVVCNSAISNLAFAFQAQVCATNPSAAVCNPSTDAESSPRTAALVNGDKLPPIVGGGIRAIKCLGRLGGVVCQAWNLWDVAYDFNGNCCKYGTVKATEGAILNCAGYGILMFDVGTHTGYCTDAPGEGDNECRLFATPYEKPGYGTPYEKPGDLCHSDYSVESENCDRGYCCVPPRNLLPCPSNPEANGYVKKPGAVVPIECILCAPPPDPTPITLGNCISPKHACPKPGTTVGGASDPSNFVCCLADEFCSMNDGTCKSCSVGSTACGTECCSATQECVLLGTSGMFGKCKERVKSTDDSTTDANE